MEKKLVAFRRLPGFFGFGVQERLQELGYEVPKDGEYAFETKEAVCRWQRKQGFPLQECFPRQI